MEKNTHTFTDSYYTNETHFSQSKGCSNGFEIFNETLVSASDDKAMTEEEVYFESKRPHRPQKAEHRHRAHLQTSKRASATSGARGRKANARKKRMVSKITRAEEKEWDLKAANDPTFDAGSHKSIN
ncbi:hypothetical protein MMC22_005416 [Lobaria immixta]|nr:hypothetical protein [Lobaria immixta]